MKVDILAIGVHPDDIELGCGGTVAHHIKKGKTVALVDLTHGELGTRGSGGLRLEEADKAREYLGIAHRENLGMADGFFQHNKENIIKIVEVVRKYRPEIVLANAVSDRHPDHGRAAKLVSDACFIAGLQKVSSQRDGVEQEKWRPKVVYHYIQDHNLTPDLVVDISDSIEEKMGSIMCYGSQFYDPKSQEPKTPISGEDFLDFVKAKAATYGRQIGAKYGEGFNVARYIGVDDLFDLL